MFPELRMRRAAGRRGRSVAWLAVAWVVIAAGSACAGHPGSSRGPAAAGKSLVWGKATEADVLDPTVSGTAISWELLRLTYENLVGLDDDLKIVPELASSWRQTSPTTYLFTLRKGVRFANGREMTADDVVGSLNRLMDPKLASSWAGQVGIRHVAASGDMRVRVTLATPKTSFVATLAGSPAAILPMKELKAGTFDPKKELLGTGPFKVAAHSQGESWSLVRNPYYWQKGVPRVDKLTVRIVPDDAARIAALRDGTIDVTTFESPDSVRLLKGQPNIKTVVQTTTDYYRLDVNAKTSIFQDERLRQALSLSIDRDRIKDVALGGVGQPTAAVPPAYQGICDPDNVPFARPDAARARQLVNAAGATGKTVQIITPTLIPMASAIAQVIQQNLQSTGLKVRIVPLEIGELYKRAYNGKAADFDMIVSFFAGYADPAMTPVRYRPDVAGFNKGWVQPDAGFNALVDASLKTGPGPERTAILRDICTRVAQDANIIPLVTKFPIVAYRSDKIAFTVRHLEGYAVPLRNIAELSMKR